MYPVTKNENNMFLVNARICSKLLDQSIIINITPMMGVA